MTTATKQPANQNHAQRIDDLGRIIRAYSDVTEKLQQSHDQLTSTVLSLREELGEKNRQLERRNRLAALGEMAAGMAHEIRNPLGGIQLYSSMLSKDLADRTDSLRLVQKISQGVRRLESLVGQVLQFTREITANPVLSDLSEIVAETVELISPSFSSDKAFCRIEGPPSLKAMIDPLLMGQAISNLILNAAEAMGEDGGIIRIMFSAARADEPCRFKLSVIDSGPGIPTSVLDKIFNPFFTTKETGTGLGLAIVHRVVEAHEGTITASNSESGGARFELRI